MDEYLDKTDIDMETPLVLQSDRSLASHQGTKPAVKRAISQIWGRLGVLEHTIRVQENRSQLIQVFAVPVTSYCFPALFFGVNKLIELIARMHPFDPQFARQIIFGTAFNIYGTIGLFGGIICFCVYKLLIRTKLPAPLPLIIAVLCSFFLPVLLQILRDFNDTLISSRLGSGMDFITYQFFVYMPQVWGLGGLAGGISAIAAILLIHPLESKSLLLDSAKTPLLEGNAQ